MLKGGPGNYILPRPFNMGVKKDRHGLRVTVVGVQGVVIALSSGRKEGQTTRAAYPIRTLGVVARAGSGYCLSTQPSGLPLVWCHSLHQPDRYGRSGAGFCH